jgi:hypothetical protein
MFSICRPRGLVVRLLVVATALALVMSMVGCSAVDQLTSGGTSAESTGGYGSPAPLVGYDSAKGSGTTVESQAPNSASGDVAANVPEADRLIIRNKTLRIEVKKVADAIDSIQAASKKSGGIITGMQVATDSGSPIYRYEDSGAPSDGTALLGYIVVRVPADKFEAFVDEVSKVGTVRYEAETSDDVTQQHVDLSARLDNLRAEEKRLREFFSAAKNVTEMLAIEQELARVRGEIESLDAQVKYLERQAAMATVTIDLNEPQPIVRPDGENWGFGEAITTGFRGAAGAIKVIIVVGITLAPFLVIAFALFFAIRAIARKRRSKRAATPPVAPTDATGFFEPEAPAKDAKK